jgi:CheY-like chemotaxis protein
MPSQAALKGYTRSGGLCSKSIWHNGSTGGLIVVKACVLCPDDSIAQLLAGELTSRGVETRRVPDFVEGFDRLREESFDLILIDTADAERALLLIHAIRTGEANRRAFIVALADPQSLSMRNFRDTGANMLLYKPFTAERLSASFDSAVTAIKHERRVSLRTPLQMTISITLNGHKELAAEIEDCSEGGVAVRTAEPLPVGGPLKLLFRLPNSADLQEVTGELVWKDLYGRSGVRFVNASETTRRLLSDCVRGSQPGENRGGG